MGLILALVAQADTVQSDDDLLNEATIAARQDAGQKLEAQAPRLEGVERIGVATIEGDTTNVSGHIKIMLTQTQYDVVLIKDVEWGHLLDEFARQKVRDDIINPETAHELRVQGVDAVLWGNVEKAEVEQIREGGKEGPRAIVRAMFSLASTAEENPGSLLWQYQAEGISDDLLTLSLENRIREIIKNSPTILMIVGGLVVVVLLLLAFRWMSTPH